jgi:hypothetical protein
MKKQGMATLVFVAMMVMSTSAIAALSATQISAHDQDYDALTALQSNIATLKNSATQEQIVAARDEADRLVKAFTTYVNAASATQKPSVQVNLDSAKAAQKDAQAIVATASGQTQKVATTEFSSTTADGIFVNAGPGSQVAFANIVTKGRIEVITGKGAFVSLNGDGSAAAGGKLQKDPGASAGQDSVSAGSSVGVYVIAADNDTINGTWVTATEDSVEDCNSAVLALDNIGSYTIGDLNGETVYLPDDGKVYRLLGDETLEEVV